MEENTKQMVNPYDYTYDQDQIIGINANALLSFMTFLEQVIVTQPKLGALLQYPKRINEIKDDKGELLKVDIDWVDHTHNSFFFTAADDKGGVPIMTEISLKAHQILHGLNHIHQDNINKKIAKKREDRNAENVFKA